MAPAAPSGGLAPPIGAPTNAPGRVTSPAVRVWSSAGTSASATATLDQVGGGLM